MGSFLGKRIFRKSVSKKIKKKKKKKKPDLIWKKKRFNNTCLINQTRGPAESWRDLFDYFNIDYFKNVLKFQVSQVDSALPTQKK